MAEVRESTQQGAPDEEELIAGARGADFDGMWIHSVRLPGLVVAHQEVILAIREKDWHSVMTPMIAAPSWQGEFGN